MDVLARIKLYDPNGDEKIMLSCMETAKAAILARRYPFQEWPEKTVEVVIPPVTDIDPETGKEIIIEEGRTEFRQETYLEPRYLDLQFRCALALYEKRGGDFETRHTENNVSRAWGSEHIPQSLLEEVVPLAAPLR